VASVRRLVAVLAADVAGYSRLMGVDEEGTLDRLKARRRELVDPKIEEHHGRISKPPAMAFWRNSPALWTRSVALSRSSAG
jgi:class 3 adenylate cyclase